MAWGDALNYCKGLSLGGQNDWRLPNVKELESLVDDTRYAPAIDSTYFPNVVASYYWSSTTYASGPNSAWVVYFDGGGVYGSGKSNGYYVRCVRGGQYGALGYLNILPSALAIPVTWPGSSASKNVTVSNGLPSAVTVGAATLTGANPADFSLGDSCVGQTLNKNGVCSITVNFIPATCGSKSATLTVPTSQGILVATLAGSACGVGGATLSGQVTDGANGLPIAGASVMVGTSSPFITDAGGNYLASDLAGGLQDMVTSKSGYDTWRVGVCPSPLQTIRKSVYLNPSSTGLRVVSVTSSYSNGKPYYFLPGVGFNVTFTAQVNWNGTTPGKVRFITSRGSYDVVTSSDTTSYSLNVGSELDSCATLQAVAIAGDGSQSPAKKADFIVTKALPVDPTIPILTNNLSVENRSGVNGSSFTYKNNSTITKDLLSQTIGNYATMPILGSAATALQFVPEFDFEFSGSDGKLSYNLSLMKNSDYSSIYKNEFTRRKNPNGLKNLTKLINSKFDRRKFPSAKIAGFELSLFPAASVEATFNSSSCGTSSNGWDSVEGFSVIAGAGEFGVTYQSILPPPVPLPWYVEGAFGLEFDAMLNINELSNLRLAGDMATNPYLALTLGAGVNDVAGVEGTGKGGVDIDWTLPASHLQKVHRQCRDSFLRRFPPL